MKNIVYKYQYEKWHQDTVESKEYDIKDNLVFFSAHNIFPKNKSDKVLDLGCAMGRLLLALKQEGCENLFGVDSDENSVMIAQKSLLNVVCADVYDFLKQDKNKYDVIYCLDLLEHIEKRVQIEILREVKKHLLPEGFLVIRVPNALAPLSSYFRYNDFTHGVSYTEDSLSFILDNAGLNHYIFRPQHLEDRQLRLAKNNYAFMLYKQFGLENQILTPNIVAVVFNNEDDKQLYLQSTTVLFNNYFEKHSYQQVVASFDFVKLVSVSLYKIFRFLCTVTAGKITIFRELKNKYLDVLNALNVFDEK